MTLKEEDYEAVFQLIAEAGDSKSSSMSAIEDARKYRFDEARGKLEDAETQLRKAHDIQFNVLSSESRGEEVPLSLMMVHAQDHLTMATMMRDLAEEFLNLYTLIKDLQKK